MGAQTGNRPHGPEPDHHGDTEDSEYTEHTEGDWTCGRMSVVYEEEREEMAVRSGNIGGLVAMLPEIEW